MAMVMATIPRRWRPIAECGLLVACTTHIPSAMVLRRPKTAQYRAFHVQKGPLPTLHVKPIPHQTARRVTVTAPCSLIALSRDTNTPAAGPIVVRIISDTRYLGKVNKAPRSAASQLR